MRKAALGLGFIFLSWGLLDFLRRDTENAQLQHEFAKLSAKTVADNCLSTLQNGHRVLSNDEYWSNVRLKNPRHYVNDRLGPNYFSRVLFGGAHLAMSADVEACIWRPQRKSFDCESCFIEMPSGRVLGRRE
jgi:hypothetical protein